MKLTIDQNNFDDILQAIQQFGEDAEDVINETLLNEVNDLFKPSIVNLVPISSRNKRHAKNSDPLIGEQETNLELYIHTKKKFNYLFFPDNAHGCKYVGKQPYNFMVDGVERKMNEAINIMLDKLINKFEE